ncbi:MAG: hypothetical protein H5T69_13985, partial [Chloroflexi bacterium]|nr:hypothetical protein [Chloroflexota bacterium]
MSKRTRTFLRILTGIVDVLMAAMAFYLAYWLRMTVPFPAPLRLGPFRNYLFQLATHLISLVI